MGRTRAELVEECKKFNIITSDSMTTNDLMDKLMEVKAPDNRIEFQIKPMTGMDAKKFLNYDLTRPWDTKEMHERFFQSIFIIAQPKLDGVRAKMHLKENSFGDIRIDTRNRSDVDFRYNEVTENFPQFTHYYKDVEDTILDGELLMPIESIDTSFFDGKGVSTKGTLTTTMAVVGSDSEKAQAIQAKYGYCEFHVFDVIRLSGKWVYDLPYHERLRLLFNAKNYFCPCSKYIKLVPSYTKYPHVFEDYKDNFDISLKSDLMIYFEELTNSGGEGLMFKDITEKYYIGKKSRAMWKLKKFETLDGFITGYIPGKGAFKGLVGSLLISAYKDGKEFEFAAVSQLTDEVRRELTSPLNGSLKPEYYGKVVEVKGQERTKNDKFKHAVLFRWRPDKDKEDCIFE